MPANLNALIRYKTINSCLYGGRRKWSIAELIDACSEALAESRGRYDTLSERTLRDDIRVMRSDILGFNAPIGQEKGLYFYSDQKYSIMSISISDSGLVHQIIKLLEELKTEVKHPELENILEKLMDMTGYKDIHKAHKQRIESFEAPASYSDLATEMEESHILKASVKKSKIVFSLTPTEKFTWGEVLHIL
jgi:hypothetical protein